MDFDYFGWRGRRDVEYMLYNHSVLYTYLQAADYQHHDPTPPGSSPFAISPPPHFPSLAILNHTNTPRIRIPTTKLKPPVLIPRRRGRITSRLAPERGDAAVADARRQRRVAAGVNARVAAREGDVGVSEEGERFVAVVEAPGQVAELHAGGAGGTVGEPGYVGAAGGGGRG